MLGHHHGVIHHSLLRYRAKRRPRNLPLDLLENGHEITHFAGLRFIDRLGNLLGCSPLLRPADGDLILERLVDKLRRVPPLAWVALFAAALILPNLGSFGFWDPWELNLADRARDVAKSKDLFDPTAAGKYALEPPLDTALTRTAKAATVG